MSVTSSPPLAWLLIATTLTLLTIPGVALFYSGMVRRKNVLNTLALPLLALVLVSLCWIGGIGGGGSLVGDWNHGLPGVGGGSPATPVDGPLWCVSVGLGGGGDRRTDPLFFLSPVRALLGPPGLRSARALAVGRWVVGVPREPGLCRRGGGARQRRRDGSGVRDSDRAAQGTRKDGDAAEQSAPFALRRRPGMGRLVRLCVGPGRRFHGHGHRRLRSHSGLRGGGGSGLDLGRVGAAREADGLGDGQRGRRRPGGHCAGGRLCRASLGHRHRDRGRRALLHGGEFREADPGLRRFAGCIRNACGGRDLGDDRNGTLCLYGGQPGRQRRTVLRLPLSIFRAMRGRPGRLGLCRRDDLSAAQGAWMGLVPTCGRRGRSDGTGSDSTWREGVLVKNCPIDDWIIGDWLFNDPVNQ
nr:hypothetical protein [Nitrospirota bacterium]